jgi:threonine dehydrogenase-like Zn-dependent dehydrogenase
MKAAVFIEPGRIVLEDRPIPKIGPRDALVRVTATTICGTDVHILKGEYKVRSGLVVGHEPVGVIEELGSAVEGYQVGQRVISGAITPCGQCHACLDGHHSQCGGKAMGGWRLGNTIDGCQAEYVVIPDATVNLAVIPAALSDEQVLLCPDIMSTGFSGAENGSVRIGDTVAVFAQGPIGLCATLGAKLMGATQIFAVDSLNNRLSMAKQVGADVGIDFHAADPVDVILDSTHGRGVDVAIEALGTSETFESCLRVLRPGGVLSSLGVYSGKIALPVDAFNSGLGDHRIITTLCPGGKERMRRLMNVISSARANLQPLITHRFRLEQIEEAYELFSHQRDGVLKVAIVP